MPLGGATGFWEHPDRGDGLSENVVTSVSRHHNDGSAHLRVSFGRSIVGILQVTLL
jgi:hypothetical protein